MAMRRHTIVESVAACNRSSSTGITNATSTATITTITTTTHSTKDPLQAIIVSTMTPPTTRPRWKEAVAGACAGAMAKTMVAPMERVKLWMQLKGGGSHNQTSAWQVTQTIYHEQGIASFWRGNAPNVMRHAGTVGLNFMLMDYYKSLSKAFVSDTKNANMGAAFVSGGLAGGTCTTVLYPIDFLRTKLAMESTGHAGMKDILWSILKTDGIRGIYQGYGIALFGVVIYRGLHLGGYDALKMQMAHYKQSPDLSWGERFGVAQTVSLLAGTLCYPIDSVRRRMMMQAGIPLSERLYRNSMHALRVIAVEEGIRGFYLGIGPNVLRSVGAAFLLVFYDGIKVLL